jgi:ATP-dependent protease HslVU (ClpYQ) peptidase subunit
MTCIVGLVDGSQVYIGGDSAGVAGYSMTLRADEKVFINAGFVFGFTSSFRMGQLLHYAFTPPKQKVEQDLYEYMVVDFVDAVRQCYKGHGWGKKDTDEAERGGTFLIGRSGRLFSVQGDFQVCESRSAYQAVGCGDEYALGSLHATEGIKPKTRVLKALEAAEHFSAGVAGPFVVKRL